MENNFTPTESVRINGETVVSKNPNAPEYSFTKSASIEHYTLNQYELETISKGVNTPFSLTLFCFSFPISIGAFVSLILSDITNLTQLKLAISVGVIGVFMSIAVVAIVYWFWSKNELKTLINIIKSREKILY
jgi:hypothetical protein